MLKPVRCGALLGGATATIGSGSVSKSRTQTLSLRSAHNSPLDVLARTGIIGFTLWPPSSWVGSAGCGVPTGDTGLPGTRQTAALIDFCMIGTVANIVNSNFDPMLEGAQVTAVLFCLFGMGTVCARRPILGPDTDDGDPEPLTLKVRAAFGHLPANPPVS